MTKNFMGPIDEEPIEFTEASALANIISGETLKVIFGKILKAFNKTTGHDHDGTNSKKIVVANVTGAVASTGGALTGALSIQPSSDVVPLTAKGKALTTKNLLEAQISDGTVHFAVGKDAGSFTVKAGTAPSAANATGVAGTLIIAADGIYLCTDTNTWVKTALASWGG